MSRPAPIAILGTGSLAAAAGSLLPDDLEPLIELPGKRFRKIGRFVRLGLAAASRAAGSAGVASFPAARTGVFLGSGLGNLPDLVGFTESVHDETGERMPSPIQFAHSVGNSAAFYIAQAFGLSGPVLALSQEEVSFECALLSASVLLEAGDIDLALVGGLDVFHPSEEAQLERMGYAPPQRAGEGAGWLVLARAGDEAAPGAPIGLLERVEVRPGESPEEIVRGLDAAERPGALYLNPRLGHLAGEPRRLERFDPGYGAFLTANAAAVCAFLAEAAEGARLHALSLGRDGELGVIGVRRLAPGAQPGVSVSTESGR